MHSYWKLLVLVLLALPTVWVAGCGPAQVSSDVTPENTGDDNSPADDMGPVGSDNEDE
jgi:uncharacterized protein YpmS